MIPSRARIVEEANEAMDLRLGGPGGVYLVGSGRELTDVRDEWRLADGGETVVRLLEESPVASGSSPASVGRTT